MKRLNIIINPEVNKVFQAYPEAVHEKMITLRSLIIETAKELDQIARLEETLKWNEPSYITNIGSTIRIDWKSKNPYQYYRVDTNNLSL